MKQWLKLSANVYRWLLYLYPANFRDKYGDEMLLLFRDVSRDAVYDGQGTLLTVWLYALADLLVNASAERLKQIWTREWLVDALVSITGLALMIGTGLMMGWVLIIIGIGLLIPWDVGIAPDGTFAKAVNSFFDGGNIILPAAFVLLFDAVAFFKTALSGWHKTSTLYWRYAALHAVVMVIGVTATLTVMSISRTFFPNTISWEGDQSYGVSLVYWGLFIMGGIVVFFAYQAYAAPNMLWFMSKHKRKAKVSPS